MLLTKVGRVPSHGSGVGVLLRRTRCQTPQPLNSAVINSGGGNVGLLNSLEDLGARHADVARSIDAHAHTVGPHIDDGHHDVLADDEALTDAS